MTACNSDGRTLRPADPSQNASVYTTTTTAVDTSTTLQFVADPDVTAETTELAFVLNLPWAEGGQIDPRFTCNGADVHPAISWLGAPPEAVEMALMVTDSDASNFVHWVIAGLDPKNPSLAEASTPIEAIEGLNGFSTDAIESIGWRGPCPPAGTTHYYRFTLYALDQQIDLPTGTAAAVMQAAIEGAAIKAAQVTGVYTAS